MDVLQNLLFGFEHALTLSNRMYCALGCAVGTMVGLLPGLGGMDECPGAVDTDSRTDR